jgi:hypothetical protein
LAIARALFDLLLCQALLPNTLWEGARPFVTAISIAGAFLWLFEHFLWRLPFLRGSLTDVPNLRGVWRVTIQSTWVNPDTGKPIEAKQGFAQIDQTASTFCMRMFTDESHSKTVAHSFVLDQSVFKLAIVYENQPHISLRETRSAYHQGSAAFSVRGHSPENFVGEYWTERKSIGTVRLHERIRGEINSFEEGSRLYERPRKKRNFRRT